jgi:leucyl-tRNA synthetase
MPVDLYVGGAEHAVLHLLYARFWQYVLYDLGYVSSPEPFKKLVNQGMIHHTSYRDEKGKYHYREDVEERNGEWFIRGSDIVLETRREKMSKSRYNVVTPDAMCEEYGADALRLYELFMGPIEDANDWDTSGVPGMRRFLDRVWRLVWDDRNDRMSKQIAEGDSDDVDLERQLHRAIKKVSDSIESLRFNTAISEMMIFVNEATKAECLPRTWVETFLKILSPFAPHVAEELWLRLGNDEDLLKEKWPTQDASKLRTDTITLAVQVDGKLRGTVEVPTTFDKEDVMKAVRAHEKVSEFLRSRTVEREIYVPGRLVNLVTK